MALNDKLLQRPDFINTLVGVMARFRKESIPLMSDIESMFHQVEVALDHCDALRFLWWPGNDMEREPQDCRLKVFRLVLFAHLFVLVMLCTEQPKIMKVYFLWKLLRH